LESSGALLLKVQKKGNQRTRYQKKWGGRKENGSHKAPFHPNGQDKNPISREEVAGTANCEQGEKLKRGQVSAGPVPGGKGGGKKEVEGTGTRETARKNGGVSSLEKPQFDGGEKVKRKRKVPAAAEEHREEYNFKRGSGTNKP